MLLTGDIFHSNPAHNLPPRTIFYDSPPKGIPHAIVVACPCCRSATTEDDRRLWRAAKAVSSGAVSHTGAVLKGGGFDPKRRFMAVMVLVMYSLFPTLVASTASMFNCSDPIAGKRYLMADLSVTCYEDAHLLFLGEFIYVPLQYHVPRGSANYLSSQVDSLALFIYR